MPGNSFQIRPAEPSDLHGVMAVVAQLWPGVTVDLASMEQAFIEGLDDIRRRYWVAVDDSGQVVGFGSLSWGGTLWEGGFSVGMLDELVVDEGWRGKGVGERLLKQITDFAKSRGFKAIELMTAGHREAAHRFYEKRGFELRGTKIFRLALQT